MAQLLQKISLYDIQLRFKINCALFGLSDRETIYNEKQHI